MRISLDIIVLFVSIGLSVFVSPNVIALDPDQSGRIKIETGN
jgi:hypothetical protein